MSKPRLSKFDHQCFRDIGRSYYAVSKQRYTEDEARKIAETEMGTSKLKRKDAYVRHRAGRDYLGLPRVCWWLEDEQKPRSCPIWLFEKDDYPRRVVAFQSYDENEVRLYGYGEFIGYKPCPFLSGIPNPMIVLDSGKVVWGCQCWWTDESKTEAIIGGRKVVNVEVEDD